MSGFVCTNCYHVGTGKMSGSIMLELALWLICFPIGIWYSLSRSKHRYGDCPQCKGSKTMIPTTTPRGLELLQKAGSTLTATTLANTGDGASVALYGGQKPKSRKLYWFAAGFLALAVFGILTEQPSQQKIEPGANLDIQAVLAQRRTAAVAAYQQNPAAVIAEIDQRLRKNDVQLARQKLDLLSSVTDKRLTDIRQKANN